MTSVDPLAVLVLVLIAAGLLYSWLWRTLTATIVYAYEQGLRFDDGKLIGVVAPGRYRHFRERTFIRRVDMRVTITAVSGQEVLTTDGVPVKTSLTAQYRVADAKRAVMQQERYEDSLHTLLQQVLRAEIAARPIEELLKVRGTLGAAMLAQAAPAAAEIGLELVSVAMKDVTLPGEVKKLFTEVVKARQEGLAALERTRGETAALRNLANAAALVTRNPQLLTLRTLQVMEQAQGNTFVLGVPGAAAVVPVRDAAGEVEPPAGE